MTIASALVAYTRTREGKVYALSVWGCCFFLDIGSEDQRIG